MELAEAAAVIGSSEFNRTFYGMEVSNTLDVAGIMSNFTRTYCPVTLNQAWSSLWRLILLFLFSGTGSFVNAFYVSAFFVTRPLRQKGYVFLACLGLCDMSITAVVVPSAIVTLMSKMKETGSMCHFLQWLTQGSTYAYSLFFMLVAVETYCRLIGGSFGYYAFISVPVGLVALLNFCVSFATSAVGVYFSLDYDYCNREHYGNYWFRIATSVTLLVIPFFVTTTLLIYVSCIVRARTIRFVHYRRCAQFEDDYEFTNLNIGCYLLFVAYWIPYFIVVNFYPDSYDSQFYSLAWLGVARSVMSSFLYSGINKHFRLAFSNLFFYICCKTHAKMPDTYHHRAMYNPKAEVHIIRERPRSVVKPREDTPQTM